MERRRAPFYLRRTKEAMVYFPERQPDGTWAAEPVFTKRITHTAGFAIDGAEFDLYQDVTRFVKRQSARAAAQGDDRRARAVGFLMSLYQRRLASSTRSMRRSLENRAKRLEEGLKQAQDMARTAPPDLPDWEDIEEMEDAERERLERMLEAVTLAGDAEDVRKEVAELRNLAERAKSVEDSGSEEKLARLRAILQEQGFFDDPDQRLLIFTEFKDTLDYLMEQLKDWGFRAGCIHGGMRPGSRDDPGSRLYAEQQFRRWGYPSPGGHRGSRRRHQTSSVATSCSTMTSPGTRTGWSSVWGASTATASASTASFSTSSPPTPLRDACSSACLRSCRRLGMLWKTTRCSTWSGRSCPPLTSSACSVTTTRGHWATQTWKTGS